MSHCIYCQAEIEEYKLVCRECKWRCEHCRSTKGHHVACTTCNRDMCSECISYGREGEVCGLCKDREDGYQKWLALGRPGQFDEWYDTNG